MFETLTNRLTQIFDQLRKRGKLGEADVDAALREVRLALLEADVHFTVVKQLLGRIRERAVGAEVSRALNPGQQVVKIVNEELVSFLGEPASLRLSGEKPWLVMLVGLQGSGKTTTAGKLGRLLRGRGERVLLAAGDPYRPAAVRQLEVLAGQLDLEVFSEQGVSPPDLARHALARAAQGGFSVVILDTAGRSQLDETLMDELRAIARLAPPVETLLCVDAMIGQEALHVAEGFQRAVPLTGLILTKMDGDARGGAAISIRAVTGVPIKFLGSGEKAEALEAYQPERLASRILGMGDVLGLIEKAEAAFDAGEAGIQAGRMAGGEFTLEDMAEMMRSSRKMGPVGQLLDMMPGGLGRAARNVDPREVERAMKQTEAIINSMTPAERRDPDLLNASRRRRIAAGSGTDVQAVNRLVRQHRDLQRLMKTLKKGGGRDLARFLG